MDRLPVIVCIGTTKVIGDSLGPFTGDYLKDVFKVRAFVYGDSRRSVTASNFSEYKRYIEKTHLGSPVIALDACLGREEEIGKIKLSDRGVLAGGALGKSLGRIGDLGLLSIVGVAGDDNLAALTEADEGLVRELAKKTALKAMSLIEKFAFFNAI